MCVDLHERHLGLAPGSAPIWRVESFYVWRPTYIYVHLEAYVPGPEHDRRPSQVLFALLGTHCFPRAANHC